MNTRGVAAQIVREVHFHQRSLTPVLTEYKSKLNHQQHAFVQQISFGSLRWFVQLNHILNRYLKKPPRTKDNIIYYLLITAVYQLMYMQKPDFAVVKDSVDQLKPLKKIWAKGLVNAILREISRNIEKLKKELNNASLAIQTAHPEWIISTLNEHWNDEQVSRILHENNQQPPLWLRYNSQKLSLKTLKQSFSESKISYQQFNANYPAICLNKPIPVEDIPGFSSGRLSVQDAAAQFAAYLLDVKTNHKVLDACAAPGGKTAHILELYPDLSYLLAVDISENRLLQIQSNLNRLNLNAHLQVGDTSNINQWWDGTLFDRILLDAPCSATGVIRRHPDIKLLRKQTDIRELCKTQRKMLNALWKTLKPGGKLIYSTCSVFRDENDRQISQFLSEQHQAVENKIELPVGHAMPSGWQILPGEDNLDGFYYASLSKKS